MLAWPYLAGGGVLLAAFWVGRPDLALLALPAGIVAWLATIPTRYPFDSARTTTVETLMGDVMASPVVGKPVKLSGEVIGRADAGSVLSEDTLFADKTGRIIVDFRSMLAGIGDLWAGTMRINSHIGQKGHVTGWMRRAQGAYLVMGELQTQGGKITAKPYLRGIITPLVYGAVAIIIGALFVTS